MTLLSIGGIIGLMKKLIVSIILAIAVLMGLILSGCVYEPLEEDLYTKNIYPDDDSTYDIGATGNEYSGGYFDDLDITNDVDIGHDLTVIHMLTVPSIVGQNISVTGKVQADRLIGDIEGYSIDVVQSSDLNIALNDTLDLVFLFVPDVIVIDFTGRSQHNVTLDDGHTTGHSIVIITGVDAMTCNTNYSALINNGGAFGSKIGQNDVVNTVVVYGGNDGLNDSYFYGVGSWTTATKTLRLTFSTVANTNDATNYIEIIATAYR